MAVISFGCFQRKKMEIMVSRDSLACKEVKQIRIWQAATFKQKY